MNHNLASPWGDRCSPPQTPFLAFYSHQSDDMLFDGQDTIEIICQSGLRSVNLSWTLHRNMVQEPFRRGDAEVLPGNKFRIKIPTKNLHAGFYDLRVILDSGVPANDEELLAKRPVTGVCTFGWRADQMAIRETRPDDFEAFWDKAKSDMTAVPLDVRYETKMVTFAGKEIDDYNNSSAALPPDYDPQGHVVEEVESCKISFAGPDGGRIYAWLAKPKGDGPFPAMLVLPGAGFAARPRPLEHARHGYLAIDVQIHGQDVDLEEYPRISGYYDEKVYEPIEAYYYYNVHKRVIQAVSFLASRADVDQSRIAAVGGSQGGRLAAVIGGIDDRITAVISCIANSPNYPHLQWVAQCNESASNGMDLTGAPPAVETQDGKCFAYYDPMNYASDIKCPVLMNGGLIDPVSPTFSVWAIYNRLGTADKEIVTLPGHGHDWSCAFDRYAWEWLAGR